jgi:hypothetical protein
LARGGAMYNVLNCLDRSSAWLSLAKGDNILAFTADSGAANLQVTITSKQLYVGV